MSITIIEKNEKTGVFEGTTLHDDNTYSFFGGGKAKYFQRR